MTTVADPQCRKTVIDLVHGIRERIYPVGRLDFHSEGLIVLTNDGDLAFKVAHPRHGSVKTYHVKVRGVPEPRLIEKLQRGITIDGKRTLPCGIEQMKTTGRNGDEVNSWYEVKLREGRTQQIRKMFKAVGHPVTKLLRAGIDTHDEAKLTELASRVRIDFVPGEHARTLLDGEDVTSLIRTPEVSMAASDVSTVPGVRRVLVRLQQELGRRSGGVLEGRDIGTKVFPETPHKFFLTARPEVRAERRTNELKEKGEPADFATVLAETIASDQQDYTRADSPLTFDESYKKIETSDLTI